MAIHVIVDDCSDFKLHVKISIRILKYEYIVRIAKRYFEINRWEVGTGEFIDLLPWESVADFFNITETEILTRAMLSNLNVHEQNLIRASSMLLKKSSYFTSLQSELEMSQECVNILKDVFKEPEYTVE